jgi:hypothetical protein
MEGLRAQKDLSLIGLPRRFGMCIGGLGYIQTHAKEKESVTVWMNGWQLGVQVYAGKLLCVLKTFVKPVDRACRMQFTNKPLDLQSTPRLH